MKDNTEEDVVITGVGIQTSLSSDLEIFWQSLLAKESSARHWEDLREQQFRSTVACRIAGILGPSFHRGRRIASEAVADAILQSSIKLPQRTGVFIGSTMGESYAIEALAEGRSRQLKSQSTIGIARTIRDAHSLHGPCRAYGSACAASNYSIGAAAETLRRNKIDAAIAGGVDPFSRIAMTGFSRSRAMSVKGRCRPFDKERDGMILGEGAAFFILERFSDAIQRGANPLAKIGKIGLTCDASHPVAPQKNGSGLATALQIAMQRNDLKREDISWICAHGSGTTISDKAEAIAIRTVFENCSTPVSAFKGALGHTMGASAAIELAVCVLSIQHKLIPPTVNLDSIEEESINVVTSPENTEIAWILNISLAFGGLNSVLPVGRCH